MSKKSHPSPKRAELTGQPEATPKASSVVSDRKKEANKANAQKSTGPRTEEGKARVSQNALKHGLRSEKNPLDISTAIPGEQTQFAELLADLTTTLQPADPLETQLVARLAQLSLRLNRAARMESATLDQARPKALAWSEKFPADFPDPNSPDFETHILAHIHARTGNELKLLSQYESRLSRDFSRILTQLRQSQKLTKQTQLPHTATPKPCQIRAGVVPNDAYPQTQPDITSLSCQTDPIPRPSPESPNSQPPPAGDPISSLLDPASLTPMSHVP